MLATEARQLTQSMLGLKLWLPRKKVGHSAVELRGHTSKPELSDVSHGTVGNISSSYVQDQNAVDPGQTSVLDHISLREGVLVLEQGVLVTRVNKSCAWFFPLPWRGEQGWSHFRRTDESQFLRKVFEAMSLSDQTELLDHYLATPLTFDHLPEQKNALNSQALPESVDSILTFSGYSMQCLTGRPNAIGVDSLDWQGSKVRVICLPHPYRCMIDPVSKGVLWRILIKLKYEI